jgi:signal transduction histidine kinase
MTKGNVNTMSAAVVLAEAPQYLEATLPPNSPDARLRELVHELRQPLSSIEAIAYYLEMTLPAGQVQARQHMSDLQRLVEEAHAILERSAGIERKPCVRAHSAGAR